MTEFRPGRFQLLPPIVKNIVIINVLMVLLQFALGKFGIDLSDYLGLHYWKSELFKPWQFITHIFMHGSYNDVDGTILHIFSNMFALWMFGSILENIWGGQRFLVFYLICGVGAAFCHLTVMHFQYVKLVDALAAYQDSPDVHSFFQFMQRFASQYGLSNYFGQEANSLLSKWELQPDKIQYINESKQLLYNYVHGVRLANGTYASGALDEAMVGASGAVFGVLFAFGYLFPNTLLYLYFFVPVKAKYFVAFYAIFELFTGIRATGGHGDNIAHFAHLGGMLFAFILLKIWNKNNRNNFY